MASKWFLETFVPSVLNRMQNNRKYPNSMILSDRQVEVCHRNMEHKETRTSWGWMGFYELAVDGYTLSLYKKGKYHILHMTKEPTEAQRGKAKEIVDKINAIEEKLDILYENKEENIEEIRKLEDEINEMWDQHNEVLKV